MTDNPSRPTDLLNARGLAAKREYVRGLEQRRDPEALSLLVECLCDESWYLRDLASQVFMRVGSDAFPVLLPLLDQGLWFTRTSTAIILGRLGCREAVPGFLRLTSDGNRAVIDTARDAIVAVGLAGGAPAIAWSLHRVAPDVRTRELDALATRDRDVAARVQELLRDSERMGVEDPRRLKDDPPAVRRDERAAPEVESAPGPPTPQPRGGDGPAR